MNREKLIDIEIILGMLFPDLEYMKHKKWPKSARLAMNQIRAMVTGMMIGSSITKDQLQDLIKETKG